MAYKKSDPRHAMNRERTGASTMTVDIATPTSRPKRVNGMATPTSRPKNRINCSTGKFATK